MNSNSVDRFANRHPIIAITSMIVLLGAVGACDFYDQQKAAEADTAAQVAALCRMPWPAKYAAIKDETCARVTP